MLRARLLTLADPRFAMVFDLTPSFELLLLEDISTMDQTIKYGSAGLRRVGACAVEVELQRFKSMSKAEALYPYQELHDSDSWTGS